MALTLGVTPASAYVLSDSQGFEAPLYNLGTLTGQNGWDRVGTGLATVQNSVVQSGSQAVALSGSAATWHWQDLGYDAMPGEFVRVTTGIRRGASPVTLKHDGFFLDAYDSFVDRIGTAGLGLSGGVPALVAFYDGANGPNAYVLESGLAWDTWYDLQMDLHFDTHTFDIYLNGDLKGSGLAFLTVATDLADVDLTMFAAAGATDIGYFDNYRVQVIPEPTSASLLMLGLGALAGRNRLARRTA